MIEINQHGVENNRFLPKRVYIFDTTLRDGDQTPSVSFTVEEKLIIARQLDRLGVDIIEAGFPITSRGEEEAVSRIAKEGLKARICALARPVRGDIDRALDCGVDYIRIFIATSDLHMRHKLMMTREEVKGRITEGIEYAKDHGVTIEFSPEDATRTEVAFLKEVCAVAVEAGADKIDVPDTVGAMTPRDFYHLVSEVKEVVDIPISVHCHNDFGLATANSLAAVEVGAEQVHVCVNGLGERAGNASLEEVVVNLIAHYGAETGIDPSRIAETSELVERLSGIQLPPNTPIVGENAFTYESGIHVHGILGHPRTYELLTPEFVGRSRRIIVGKHTGRHAVRAILEEIGLRPGEELNAIVEESETLEIDLEMGVVRNLEIGLSLNFKPLPGFLLDILKAGGLVSHMRRSD
jgi:isopropylmalate/citramalate/homocitrate synthase-like protein